MDVSEDENTGSPNHRDRSALTTTAYLNVPDFTEAIAKASYSDVQELLQCSFKSLFTDMNFEKKQEPPKKQRSSTDALDGSSQLSTGQSLDTKHESEEAHSFDGNRVSFKSHDSMDAPKTKFQEHPPGQEEESKSKDDLDSLFQVVKERMLGYVKIELNRLHKVLISEYPECLTVNHVTEEQKTKTEAVLNLTLDFLRDMKRHDVVEQLQTRRYFNCCQKKLKYKIYTELHIIEGGAKDVNLEHEVRLKHSEMSQNYQTNRNCSRKQDEPETIISCEDIFKHSTQNSQKPMRDELTEGGSPIREEPTEEHRPVRTILTKGVAGIGKTVLTQKFSLDWAEGRTNQDIQLLFPFTFRALNVLRDKSFSLKELIRHFFGDPNQTGHGVFEQFHTLNVAFILDGLDECRLNLDFSRAPDVSDLFVSVPVEVLLVNLIRGNLLPTARLWITTRPAAASQIPDQYVSMVTEVRGFTDAQKDQYFRIKFRDEAEAVISHIKTCKSLYIMCHMPMFCWITATVLEYVLKSSPGSDLPRTLTQLYVHFLVVQAKVSHVKYDGGCELDRAWTPERKRMVEGLGRLAFEQLQKGNLIFYESDLKDSDINVSLAAVYSGVFTQVFREEPGLYQDRVYCFIHLSVQEFMAALYVHQTFLSTGFNLLCTKSKRDSLRKMSVKLKHLHRTAIDQALDSPNGHLDLFLRFLLGLSLPDNQRMLHGLLSGTGCTTSHLQDTAEYIKTKIQESECADKSLNLFHCLNELNDRSLLDQVQQCLSSGGLSRGKGLSPAQCLSSCNLSGRSCVALSSVLSSPSSLTHLDLSNNPLKDTGIQKLCEGLKSTHCRLEQLRGCVFLASALMTNPSHLKELDLSYNHPGPQGAHFLQALQTDPLYRLETLRLEPGGAHCLKLGPRRYFCSLSLDPNTAHPNLQLSNDNTAATCVSFEQDYPDLPDRFDHWHQLLCTQALPERCYWEVQWSGEVYISVAYKKIAAKEKPTIPFLDLTNSGFTFWSDKHRIHLLNVTPSCFGRIGVYVDWPASCISFYKVSSDNLTNLYTCKTTFTEPLVPGFSLLTVDSSVMLCDLVNR
ncbi:hypothetical protein WMY93_028846 [Mugilogobius chulae]|uniref:Uncharacterized protein n=1 Tax=Mugilogobius chulae TaxID=88201 RepID=A0AAW0MU75_9GOBI